MLHKRFIFEETGKMIKQPFFKKSNIGRNKNMILRYVTNLKLAKELYQASKPKLQEDKGMIELFEHTFGLQKELVKYVALQKQLLLLYTQLALSIKTFLALLHCQQ